MDCNCINLTQLGAGAAAVLFAVLAALALVWKVADLVRWCKKFTLAVVERTPKPAQAKGPEPPAGFSLGSKVVLMAALVLGGGAAAYLLMQLA